MTMGMIERVARAMFDLRTLGDSLDAFDGTRFKATSWRDFEGLARAAIGAMRQPTEAMLNAASDAGIAPDPMNSSVTYANGREATEIWHNMIEAALRE